MVRALIDQQGKVSSSVIPQNRMASFKRKQQLDGSLSCCTFLVGLCWLSVGSKGLVAAGRITHIDLGRSDQERDQGFVTNQ